MTSAGPLAGVRVVEVAELLPGPFFTHDLVNMGAEVVKVERPGSGDPMRSMRPASYEYINGGKKVAYHDLRTPEGVESILGLLDSADVFVEGSRPGVMERRGLGWERLSAHNDRLIYVSLTGFGQTGPLAQVPGHDLNYQAYSGMLSLAGKSGAGPSLGNSLPISDYAGASTALSATLAALYQRTTTGRGQYLDVSIADAIGHWVVPLAAHLREQGLSGLREVRSTLQTRAGYETFVCADDEWIAIGALEPRFLERLLVALELTGASDQSAEQINGLIADHLLAMKRADVLDILIAHDVPVTVVNTPVQYCESASRQSGESTTRDLPGFPVPFSD